MSSVLKYGDDSRGAVTLPLGHALPPARPLSRRTPARSCLSSASYLDKTVTPPERKSQAQDAFMVEGAPVER